MAAREVKCRWCGSKSSKDDMDIIIHETAKTKQNRYFHKGKCLEEYLADREFQKKENLERDILNETIKRIHHLDVIPSQFYESFLTPLRNGTYRQGRTVKKSKQGVPYTMINEAYKIAERYILNSRRKIEFQGAMGELKYGLAIVVDKLPVARKRMRQRELERQIVEERESIAEDQEDVVFNNRTIEFQKKEHVDISDFLDD